MTLTITLSPDDEARLRTAAQEQRITPEELATQAVLQILPPAAPERPETADTALEAEIAALEAALPPDWREVVGKFDSSKPPTEEQRLEREKIRAKAGAFGEILDEKYRKQGFKL